MGSVAEEIDAPTCRWAVLAQAATAFAPVVVPLVLLATLARASPYLRRQVAAALNFQITVLLALALCSLAWGSNLGPLLTMVVVLAALPNVLVACLACANGQEVRYPISLRLVR